MLVVPTRQRQCFRPAGRPDVLALSFGVTYWTIRESADAE